MSKPNYLLTELAPPPMYESTAALAISNDSVVVGMAGAPPMAPRTGPVFQAVMWKSGIPQPIGDGSLNPSEATAVNDSEEVVGQISVGADVFENHAFLFDGQLQDLASALDMSWANANDINDGGVVVGMGSAELRGFIWNSKANSPPVLLAPNTQALGINAAGTVVGIENPGPAVHGFIFRNGEIQDLGQGIASEAFSKTSEWVTGRKWSGDSPKAFRMDASLAQTTIEEVGPANAAYSLGRAINDAGVTVGSAELADDSHVAFVDFPATSPFAGSHNLADVITNGVGWTVEEPTGINNHGEIVGWAKYQGHSRAFLLTPALAGLEKAVSSIEAAFKLLIGGVEQGGGGTGITFPGKPHPIDPHGPFSELWMRAFRENPEMLVGLIVGRLASLSGNPQTREMLDQAAAKILRGVFGQVKKIR